MASTNRRARQKRYESKYDLTVRTYNRMLYDQACGCAICGAEVVDPDRQPGRLHVDHDHVTGEVRGLLCVRCNTGLGKFYDDPDLLLVAYEYLCYTKPSSDTDNTSTGVITQTSKGVSDETIPTTPAQRRIARLARAAIV